MPALRARDWLPTAIACGADAIVIDLEDGTPPADKERAREFLRGIGLADLATPIPLARVNAGADELAQDIVAAIAGGMAGVILPKVDGSQDVLRAVQLVETAETRPELERGLALFPMIETPRSVFNALAIADAHPRVAGLALGGGDLAAYVGMARSREGTELLTARATLALAAAAAHIGAIDTPYLDLSDAAGARTEADAVGRMGFTGKFAIHPSQVAGINAAFSPNAAAIADAEGVVDTFEQALARGQSVTTFRGRMIDRPDVVHARQVLARARLANPHP